MKAEKKQTFTYATLPSARGKAIKKARKEGLSLSEKIDEWIKSYIQPSAKLDMTGFGRLSEDQLAVLKQNGLVTTLNYKSFKKGK